MNTIRLARPSDASSIIGIYTPYILNTSFTFETEVPSNEAFAKRIISYLEDWPWLVCEINGVVSGYAYATRHRERAAYQWCVESSVYVHDNFQQRGVAGALYAALFEILKLLHFSVPVFLSLQYLIKQSAFHPLQFLISTCLHRMSPNYLYESKQLYKKGFHKQYYACRLRPAHY